MSSPIIVFGSINMDLVVYSDKQPAKGETILGNSFETFQGGKGANQAVTVSRLGFPVSLIGKVGNDVFGNELLESLNSEHVDTSMVGRHEGPSGVAFIYVFEETSENQIIVISGSNEQVKSNQMPDKELSASDVLISQLEVPPSEIEDLFIRAKNTGTYRILNTAPGLKISKNLIHETDLLVMNEPELENLTERTLERQNADSISQAIKDLNLSTTQSVVVTLGSKGAYVYVDQKGQLIEGYKVEAVDTTGSGDCFIGALASQYLESKDLLDSVNFANKAAALSVTKKGASASMPSMEEVVNFHQIT
jgi:ribokinase